MTTIKTCTLKIFYVGLSILLLAACALAGGLQEATQDAPAPAATSPGNNNADSTPEPAQQTAQATPSPTVTLTPTSSVLLNQNYGFQFIYTLKVDDSPRLTADSEISFPVTLKFDANDPMKPIIFCEIPEGTQVVVLAGMNAGVYCYVTYHFEAAYELSGDFYPEDCHFDFTFEDYYETVTITAIDDGCGAGNYVPEGGHLFYRPEPGPHTITSDLEPLVIKPESRITHTYRIEDLVVPSVVDCW